ncbi:NAD(P)-binding domain-containing protein [Mesorhizobium sp. CAU 1732]|uniref:NADPH-dependent F420 reductase n=1 Tax=Mesorhizobium sp. CAU 1732 TaxID=3140358 RepID=UPI003261818B
MQLTTSRTSNYHSQRVDLYPAHQRAIWRRKMTTTAIIGLGNMGKGIAKRLSGETNLVLSSRNAETAIAFAAALGNGAEVLDIDNAVQRADVIILALPYEAAIEVAKHSGLSGKIVIDITNPVKPDFSGLTIGHTTSAAEELQAIAPSAKIVKAYNTVFASIFDLPAAQTATVPVFLAGNDHDAVSKVEALVTASGFKAEKTGALDAARLIEPLAMLNIRFGYALGRGTSIAPAWQDL